MKLVPEQIKLLREKRDTLLEYRSVYENYCKNRDRTQMDGVGSGCVVDYQHEFEHHQNKKELNEINELLKRGEFKSERNFEVIDIGTAFTVTFDDGYESERMVFVESHGPIGVMEFASRDTDFGRAINGKKAGDRVTYKVKATGKEISLTIDEIDNIKENYEHFIREKKLASRISGPEKKKLRYLKENDIEEYNKRHALTRSQILLLEEELGKISYKTTDPHEIARREYIKKLLESDVATPPTDDSIGIGSNVTISIMDENGDVIEKSFEMINQAVSTELESHYVERISPLGHALYGLHKDEAFTIRRKHKPSLKGLVDSVDNGYDLDKNRVR